MVILTISLSGYIWQSLTEIMSLKIYKTSERLRDTRLHKVLKTHLIPQRPRDTRDTQDTTETKRHTSHHGDQWTHKTPQRLRDTQNTTKAFSVMT